MIEKWVARIQSSFPPVVVCVPDAVTTKSLIKQCHIYIIFIIYLKSVAAFHIVAAFRHSWIPVLFIFMLGVSNTWKCMKLVSWYISNALNPQFSVVRHILDPLIYMYKDGCLIISFFYSDKNSEGNLSWLTKDLYPNSSFFLPPCSEWQVLIFSYCRHQAREPIDQQLWYTEAVWLWICTHNKWRIDRGIHRLCGH